MKTTILSPHSHINQLRYLTWARTIRITAACFVVRFFFKLFSRGYFSIHLVQGLTALCDFPTPSLVTCLTVLIFRMLPSLPIPWHPGLGSQHACQRAPSLASYKSSYFWPSLGLGRSRHVSLTRDTRFPSSALRSKQPLYISPWSHRLSSKFLDLLG